MKRQTIRRWRLAGAIGWTCTALLLAVTDLLGTQHPWYRWLQIGTYALIGAISWAAYVSLRRKDRVERN